jgi:hypothetical protein
MKEELPSANTAERTQVESSAAAMRKLPKQRLVVCLHTNDEEWRVVWLLYMFQDINSGGAMSSPRFSEIVTMISSAPDISIVVRLWAKKVGELELYGGNRRLSADDLHCLGYLDEGNQIFGKAAGNNS